MRKYNYKIKPLMKIKTSIVRVTMMLCLAMLTTMGAWAQFSGGDGSQENPYIISNVDDLNNFASSVKGGTTYKNQYLELSADIIFDNTQESNFEGVGGKSGRFNGHFDGKGHTISGVRMKSERDVAFFIYLSSAAEVKNLTLTDAVISLGGDTDEYIAGICGFNAGKIVNCHVTNSVTLNVSNTEASIGGIAGCNNDDAVVEGCTSAVTINCNDNSYVGGIVAFSYGIVKNCLVYGGSINVTTGRAAAVVGGALFSENYAVTGNYYTLNMWFNNSPIGTNKGIGFIESSLDRSKIVSPNFAVVYDKEPGVIHDATPDTTYAYDGIKKYEKGIVYNGMSYVRSENYRVINNNIANNISEADLGWKDVILLNRVLYKDGTWNTIFLPFFTTVYGGVFEGAEIRSLQTASVDGSTLNLTFDVPVELMDAGRPYIVRWEKPADYEGNEKKYDIVNPVFTEAEITEDVVNFDSGSGDTRVRFLGTYDAMNINALDKSILFLGANNKLYYPDGEAVTTIGACRAYFKIGEDADTNNARRFTSINIDFGDNSTTTAINSCVEANAAKANNAWYTLDGRKLNGEPKQKGVYIYNGKVRVKK